MLLVNVENIVKNPKRKKSIAVNKNVFSFLSDLLINKRILIVERKKHTAPDINGIYIEALLNQRIPSTKNENTKTTIRVRSIIRN